MRREAHGHKDIFNGRYAVSGAQPVEIFLRALDTAAGGQAAERGA